MSCFMILPASLLRDLSILLRTKRVLISIMTRAAISSGTTIPTKMLSTWADFNEKKTFTRADTIVTLNTYPNSIVTWASLRRILEEMRLSLSRVVNPAPVRIERT